METTTLRVSRPRDLLGMVPYQLGFTPTDSLVLISLRGRRRRVGLVLRVDLPDPDGGLFDDVAGMCVQHVAADGATGALLVLYSDHPDPMVGDASALLPLVAAVEAALEAAAIDLVDAWHVGPARYRSLVCDQPCCPPEGHDVAELATSVVGAEMVMRGRTVAADRQEALGDLRPADPAVRAQVERAVAKHELPTQGGAGGRRARWGERAMGAWRSEVEAVRSGRGVGPDPDTAGVLLAGLGDPRVRDAVMLACVPGSGLEPERYVRAGGTTDGAERLFQRVFDTGNALRPDPEQVAAASEVLRSLVRLAQGHRAAPALALLAWLAWWSGDGAFAGDYVELALRCDPGHRLALLLAESVGRGVPPGWAQQDRFADWVGRHRR